MVCTAFGLQNVPKEKEDALNLLRDFLERAHRDGRKPLVIIDEAQNLSPSSLEELRMLSNFQIGQHAPCQIFLVGQPQFRDTMAHPNLEQLRQRVIASYHLGPLGRDDCSEYLNHRLQLVGWKDDPEFSSDAVDSIFENTGGIPRRINTLASRLLLYGFLEDLHAFTRLDVERVAADLRDESGIAFGSSGKVQVMDADDNYLTQMEGETQWAKGTVEHRLNKHEKAIRNIFRSLAKAIDPSWLSKK